MPPGSPLRVVRQYGFKADIEAPWEIPLNRLKAAAASGHLDLLRQPGRSHERSDRGKRNTSPIQGPNRGLNADSSKARGRAKESKLALEKVPQYGNPSVLLAGARLLVAARI